MSEKMIWGVLIHLGMNMWHDHYVGCIERDGIWAGIPDDDYLEHIRRQYQSADHVRFDEKTWREVSESYAKNGVNAIVLDLGEAVVYPSHPELAVRGSWPADKLKAELRRLRTLGFEVFPKLNFSTTHCAWLGEYARMVSTPEYYRVCADLIRDVCELFDGPRLFHIGMDEESATHHTCCSISVARQGELWWHDLDFLRTEVEKRGSRPWMWLDFVVEKAKETKAFERLPKDVLMCPWYYGSDYESDKAWPVKAMCECVEHGYDILPSGSLCFFTEDSMERLARYCKGRFPADQVKGFLVSPWLETCSFFKRRLIENGESLGRARRIYEATCERKS